MRRPTSALAKAFLGTALAATSVSAQQPPPTAPAPGPGAGAPAAAPAPVPTYVEPVNAARGARHLLRNGWDYIGYQEYERALNFLREAESRQAELTENERLKLRQGIERAQRGLREAANGVGGERAYALSGASRRRPGALALAAPADAYPTPGRPPAVEPEPIRLAGGGNGNSAAGLVNNAYNPAPAPAAAAAPMPAPAAAADAPAPEPAVALTPAPIPALPDEVAVVTPPAVPLPAEPATRPELPLPVADLPPPVADLPPPARPEPAKASRPERVEQLAFALPELPPAVADLPVPALPADPASAPLPAAAELPPAAPTPAGDAGAMPLTSAPPPTPAAAPALETDSLPPLPASLADDNVLVPPPAQAVPMPMPMPTAGAALATVPMPAAAPAPEPTPDLPANPPAEPPPPPAAETMLPAAGQPAEPPRADTPPPPMGVLGQPAAVPPRSPDSFIPQRSEAYTSTLTPELQREVDRIAQRQEEEMRQNPAPPAIPGGDAGNADNNSGGGTGPTSTRLEISRAPSPTEARPIRAIPVPEEFVPLPIREWDPNRKYWAAAATCHLPLYFQDASLERYGYSMEQRFGWFGRYLSIPIDDPRQSKQRNQIIQPFFSAGLFAAQIALLPYNMIMDPPWESEYDLGYYRPGDRVPKDVYYLPLTGVGPPLRGKNYAVPANASNGAPLPPSRW